MEPKEKVMPPVWISKTVSHVKWRGAGSASTAAQTPCHSPCTGRAGTRASGPRAPYARAQPGGCCAQTSCCTGRTGASWDS